VAISDDAFCGTSRFGKIWFGPGKPAQARFGVGHDCHQRLVYLMCDRCDEFTHRCQPGNMHEVRLSIA
jgi:hypothetical protein